MNKIIGKESREKLKQIDVIEVFALAYMRGMNIDNSILIFEEAQNATPKQMKLLLTRIGTNSKFFISGDLEQTDRYKNIKDSDIKMSNNFLLKTSNEDLEMYFNRLINKFVLFNIFYLMDI